MRRISDARTVIQQLGGSAAVAELTGRTSYKTISNWAKKNQFPPWTHVVIQNELKQRGCEATLDLWRWQRKRGNGVET